MGKFVQIAILLVGGLLLPQGLLAQPTGTIRVVGGSQVPFVVNSLRKYTQGITHEGWSRIRIRYNDTGPTTLGWGLNIRAQTLGILSDEGEPPLPLATLEVRVVHVEVLSGVYSGTAVPTPPIPLTDAYTQLLTDSQVNNVDLIVTVSYDLGTRPANRLLGRPPGHYFVDLQFQLVSLP